jgi:hypothetical protein
MNNINIENSNFKNEKNKDNSSKKNYEENNFFEEKNKFEKGLINKEEFYNFKQKRPSSPAWNKHKYDLKKMNEISKQLKNENFNLTNKTEINDYILFLKKENESISNENNIITKNERNY